MVMPMAVEEGRRAWTPNSTTQSTVTRTSATPTSTTQHQWNNRYLGNEKVNSWLVSSAIHRGPTEDIIHYFTLMSSELHYLDIILKIENLTLMSSASGKFDINVLSIWENHLSNTHIFVILPVLFLFSHVLNASEQLQLLIYALLSLKCRELHLRVF